MDQVSGATSEPLLSASAVEPVVAFAFTQGISPQAFEDALGMSALGFMANDQMFEADRVDRLWKAIDAHSTETTASVITATQINARGFYNSMGKGASFAPTVREALKFVCEFRQLISHDLELNLDESNSLASFSFFDPCDVAMSGHANQSGGAIQWQWLRDWVVGDIALDNVSFMHGCNGPAESYTDFFEVDVAFDQWSDHSRFVFDREILDRPLRTSDSVAFALARAQAQQFLRQHGQPSDGSLLSRIRKAITESAEEGQFDLSAAINRANVSMRTAQRHAAREGLNLYDLLQEQRAKLACEWLTDDPDIPLSDIAERLGYSDDRAFRRAFKQWIGLSPRQFSKALADY